MEIPENLCTKTIHQVEKQFLSRRVPIKLFKELLKASKELDFTKVNDPVIKSRYMESRNKIEPYFRRVIQQDIYSNSDDTRYEELMNLLITLFSIFDAIITGRLYITDIAQQETTIINDFLDSYGFLIHRIFENQIKIDLAQHIYRNIRLKGTTQLLTILLSNIGFNAYQINEYELNMLGNKFVLVPHTTYKSHGASGQDLESNYIYVEDLDDILWTVTDEELRQIFNQSLSIILTANDSLENEQEESQETNNP